MEKNHKSSSLLPGKIGVRNASETTTELLKYPELPGPFSGPWTPAVGDFALRASHTKTMEYWHFRSTEFFSCFFIITDSHAWCLRWTLFSPYSHNGLSPIFTGLFFLYMADHIKHEHCLRILCQIYQSCYNILKGSIHTIGNCQRLAFTVGVSQHMH